MTTEQHLLTILAEECAEVAHRVSKALRFGLEEIQPGQGRTNAERIVEELEDLAAVDIMLRNRGLLPAPDVDRVVAKNEKVLRFLEYSRRCGTLED